MLRVKRKSLDTIDTCEGAARGRIFAGSKADGNGRAGDHGRSIFRGGGVCPLEYIFVQGVLRREWQVLGGEAEAAEMLEGTSNGGRILGKVGGYVSTNFWSVKRPHVKFRLHSIELGDGNWGRKQSRGRSSRLAGEVLDIHVRIVIKGGENHRYFE
jgi:hypothetical protein